MTNTAQIVTPVPPAFINVIVVAMPIDGGYQVTCIPPTVSVTEPSTLLNFQLIDPTPATVRFNGIEQNQGTESQFSDPSISLDGKQLTLCDANSVWGGIDVTLLFSNGGDKFKFDPQVQNTPKVGDARSNGSVARAAA